MTKILKLLLPILRAEKSECHKKGNLKAFIEFVLEMIDKTLKEIVISVKNMRSSY